MFRKLNTIQLFIFLITLAVYFIFSNHKPAIYNHHVYIANSILHGTFEVNNSPSWHNDVAIVDGKKYGIYGPSPAIVLLPLVAIFGLNTPEGTLNLIIAAIGVVLLYQILTKLNFEKRFKLWLTFFFAFGTLQFFSAAHDQTWWFTYIIASFFLLLYLNEILGFKRAFLAGLFLGAAYGARTETIFAIIISIVAFNRPKVSLKNSLLLLLGLAIPFGLISYYNFSRFGNIFDSGYANFVLREPGTAIPYGLFNLNYLLFNFKTYFLTGPEIIDNFPYFKPPWIGMSILLISPAFVYVLKSINKNPLNLAILTSGILMAVPSLLYYYPGWTEFGWKHSVVFTPLFLILTAYGMQNRLSVLKKGLILISIIVNVWGVLWWRLNNWFY